MCSIIAAVAVAQFALGAASAVTQYQAQQQAYDQQREFYNENRKAASKAAANSYAAVQNRQLQEAKAASQELQTLNRDALRARSTATVAAGEAGVTGLSVDALIADYYGQEGRYERTIDNNYQMQEGYLRAEMEGVESTARSRIGSIDQGTKPSFADAAIRVLGSGIDAFSSYHTNRRRLN